MKVDLISKSWHVFHGKLVKKGERFSATQEEAKALMKRGRAVELPPPPALPPPPPKKVEKRKDLEADTFTSAAPSKLPPSFEFPAPPPPAEKIDTWAKVEPKREVLSRPKAPKE